MSAAAVLVVIGLVLCLAGAVSVRVSVLAAGFGTAWLLADAFGAPLLVGLLVAVVGALAAWALTVLIATMLMFASGCVVGAVLGAKLFVVLGGADASWLLAILFVPALAVVSGFLAGRYERRFLVWATAFAGAALVLSGLARFSEGDLGLLRRPDGIVESVVLVFVWVALGLLGHRVQQHLSGRHRDRGPTS